MRKMANGNIENITTKLNLEAGEITTSIREKLIDTDTPVGISLWITQGASDAPNSASQFTIIYKRNSSDLYSRVYCFSSHIFMAATSSSVPSELTWTQLA